MLFEKGKSGEIYNAFLQLWWPFQTKWVKMYYCNRSSCSTALSNQGHLLEKLLTGNWVLKSSGKENGQVSVSLAFHSFDLFRRLGWNQLHLGRAKSSPIPVFCWKPYDNLKHFEIQSGPIRPKRRYTASKKKQKLNICAILKIKIVRSCFIHH